MSACHFASRPMDWAALRIPSDWTFAAAQSSQYRGRILRSYMGQSMTSDQLDLAALARGMPALTKAMGRVHAESAAVCLSKHRHRQGINLKVDSPLPESPAAFRLHWPKVTPQMRRTYNDLHDATEQGAVGIAILLIRSLTKFVVIERAMKRTGIDYWLGDASSKRSGLPFQNKARLEVSGILQDAEGRFSSRMAAKNTQTMRSDSTGIPAYVVVVEFSTPKAGLSVR